jgi:hypothetical protein
MYNNCCIRGTNCCTVHHVWYRSTCTQIMQDFFEEMKDNKICILCSTFYQHLMVRNRGISKTRAVTGWTIDTQCWIFCHGTHREGRPTWPGNVDATAMEIEACPTNVFKRCVLWNVMVQHTVCIRTICEIMEFIVSCPWSCHRRLHSGKTPKDLPKYMVFCDLSLCTYMKRLATIRVDFLAV